MYSDWSGFAGLALVVIFIWLGVLSYFTWRNRNFLDSLFPKSGQGDIREKFEEIAKLVDRSDRHVQRVALLRYNPYGDTGGDQSFTICLLDNMGDGVVITSLHARSGTRVFAKQVIKGEGRSRFSREEQLTVRKALM